jgi:hypothetical protein
MCSTEFEPQYCSLHTILPGLTASCYAVGGLYPAVDAFFIASIVSVALRSGVVFVDLSAPLAPKASDIATALTLSGISAMITKSYSPNEK